MEIRYEEFKIEYVDEFLRLVHTLYNEDEDGEKMSDEKIHLTINFFKHNPGNGQILLFLNGDSVLGYAILIHNWSNEFGGKVIFIDELFIKPNYRNQKIGTHFIDYLSTKKQEGFKAIFLEVFDSNPKALDFYKRNGFGKREVHYLKKDL